MTRLRVVLGFWCAMVHAGCGDDAAGASAEGGAGDPADGASNAGGGDGDNAPAPGDGDGTTTGDGDGDPAGGRAGDGDAMTPGDGDGDAMTSGDGDGMTAGDGDDGAAGSDGASDGDGAGDGDAMGATGLFWFSTCGFPVCGPPSTEPPGADACTTQVEGEPCNMRDERCATGDCGASLLCTDRDPKAGPGGCPISRARFKRDIRYIGEAERRAYADQLLSLPLATYRYRAAPGERRQLGFILEDVEPSSQAAVDGARDRVDLYGYTSMAVAAIQEQSQQVHALQRELERLRSEVEALRRQCE